MSNRDQRSLEARLVEYIANHSATAKLNFDRAEASGDEHDKAWAAFLTEVSMLAQVRLNQLRERRLDEV